MSIDQWLLRASQKLKTVGIDSNRLDGELILADILNCERIYLHAHGDETLTDENRAATDALLARRQKREPIAYILGQKEFYGREFIVTPDVLIPRPETETMIELVENLDLAQDAAIADIGTGSGAIALTLKLNRPERRVWATDVSATALAIAGENARRLGADVVLLQGDLAESLPQPVDLIVANLPYVDRTWKRSPETDFEPAGALFAEEQGLGLIRKLIAQASHHLRDAGLLVLEADPCQHNQLVAFAAEQSYLLITIRDYIVVLRKG